MTRAILLVCGAFVGWVGFGTAVAGAADRTATVKSVPDRTGAVRVVDHALVDDGGPFLGLGVSYFTALSRCRNDRARVESDLRFLSAQGFNYYRMLSMVGWHRAWDGLEIAPVTFTNRAGQRVEAWPDYWKRLTELIDLGYDRYGMRAQITVFADAQLMPGKERRIEHMRRLLADVVRGREQKIILLEVANEAWQNGFPGDQGIRDLREFTKFLADRTAVPVATTSNHEDDFAKVYANSAADIATWHFSRDRRTDDGWKPVYDCWDFSDRPGFPPASSNEPIGPGASVAAESSSIRLVMAAAFAYAAKLPMYVFHSQAGVFGKTRFEDTPAIREFHRLKDILPADLPNWRRNDGKQKEAPFTVFAGGQPNRYTAEVPASRDGCVRNIGSRKEDRFVCVPIGIRADGLQIEAREDLEFEAINPLTGKSIQSARMKTGERIVLSAGPGALILTGRVSRTARQ
ncbi:MAG TPA: hypothetical protein VNT99_18005 [Methylomirabilota bacterium]|nr:hypothetical protein [Methylomirabilota bacterium]